MLSSLTIMATIRWHTRSIIKLDLGGEVFTVAHSYENYFYSHLYHFEHSL